MVWWCHSAAIALPMTPFVSLKDAYNSPPPSLRACLSTCDSLCATLGLL
jgi:hypothetical protein